MLNVLYVLYKKNKNIKIMHFKINSKGGSPLTFKNSNYQSTERVKKQLPNYARAFSGKKQNEWLNLII